MKLYMSKRIFCIMLSLLIFVGAYFAVPQAINPLQANNVLAARNGDYVPGAYKVVCRFGISVTADYGCCLFEPRCFLEGDVLAVDDKGIAHIPGVDYRTNKPSYAYVDVSSYINNGCLVLYIRY